MAEKATQLPLNIVNNNGAFETRPVKKDFSKRDGNTGRVPDTSGAIDIGGAGYRQNGKLRANPAEND